MPKDIENFIESEEQEFFKKKAQKIEKENKIKTILGIILLIGLGFYLFKNSNTSSFSRVFNAKKSTVPSKNIKQPQKPLVDTKVKVDTQNAEEEQDEENLIVLNVENEGRDNPFTPYKEKSLYIMNNIDEALLKGLPSPQDNLKVDESAKKLYELKVSGLLYDKNKSSAIVNIEGKDYLVHKYDKLFGFKIINISKDNVEVQYGTNSYQLRIGEMITGDIFENNTYNINNKFAGKELPELENIKFMAEEEQN